MSSPSYELYVSRLPSIGIALLDAMSGAGRSMFRAAPIGEPVDANPEWFSELSEVHNCTFLMAASIATQVDEEVLTSESFLSLVAVPSQVLRAKSDALVENAQTLTSIDDSGLELTAIRNYLATLSGASLADTIAAIGRIENGVIHPGDEQWIMPIPGYTYLLMPLVGDWVQVEVLLLACGLHFIYAVSWALGGPFGPEADVLAGSAGPVVSGSDDQNRNQASSITYFDRYYKGRKTSSGASDSGGSGGSGGSEGSDASEGSGGSSGSASSESSEASSAASSSSESSGSRSSSSSSPSSSSSSYKSSSSSPPYGSSASSHSSSSCCDECPKVVIVADTNRDGEVDEADILSEEIRLRFDRTHGAICLVNSDYDINQPWDKAKNSEKERKYDFGDDVVAPPNDPQEQAEIRIYNVTPEIEILPTDQVVVWIVNPPNELELDSMDPAPLYDRISVWRRPLSSSSALAGNACPGTPHARTKVLGHGKANSDFELNDEEKRLLNDVGYASFWVEGCDYASDVVLRVRLIRGDRECCNEGVRIMPAPAVQLPDGLAAEWAILTNPLFAGLTSQTGLKDRLAALVPEVRVYDVFDQWAQDEWQLGIQSWPDQYQPTGPGGATPGVLRDGINCPRLSDQPEPTILDKYGLVELTGPVCSDMSSPKALGSWKDFPVGSSDSSGDYGGNIEVLPPYTHGGQEFGLGHILIGTSLTSLKLRKFLMRQRIQVDSAHQPLEVDTEWLSVGHVDEILHVFSAPGTHGFKVLFASPARAQALLTAPPPPSRDWSVFFWGGTLPDQAGVATGPSPVGGTTLLDATRNFPNPPTRFFVRIYAGAGAGQVAEVKGGAQGVLTIGKTWLLPSPSAAFTMLNDDVLPNTAIGWQIALDPTSKYVLVHKSQAWSVKDEAVPAIMTALEVRSDAALWALNGAISTKLAAIKQSLITRTGMSPSDFVDVPVIYSGVQVGPDVEDARAYMPSFVNCVGAGGHLLFAHPFGPRWNGTTDAMIADVVAQVAAAGGPSVSPSADFLSTFFLYHTHNGEVHCGTNIRRSPAAPDDRWRQWWKKWGRT